MPALSAMPGATRPTALNPLSWVLSERGIEPLSQEGLRAMLADVRAAGFGAVMADVPAELAVEKYADLLAELDLRPAPGYFAAAFEDGSTLTETLELARCCARQHAALGLTEVFVAGTMQPHRVGAPAVGTGSNEAALADFAANLDTVARAMAAEGVRACLHPHVGTLVETEPEVRFVLDHTDPAAVGFGPDTGHLFWAGMKPEAIIGEYAHRVGGVHVKDVHRDAATAAVEAGLDYNESTFGRHLWTEPGRGDVDLLGVLAALQDFTGWWVVEVDVPDGTTPQQSAALSAAWVAEHLTTHTQEEDLP